MTHTVIHTFGQSNAGGDFTNASPLSFTDASDYYKNDDDGNGGGESGGFEDSPWGHASTGIGESSPGLWFADEWKSLTGNNIIFQESAVGGVPLLPGITGKTQYWAPNHAAGVGQTSLMDVYANTFAYFNTLIAATGGVTVDKRIALIVQGEADAGAINGSDPDASQNLFVARAHNWLDDLSSIYGYTHFAIVNIGRIGTNQTEVDNSAPGVRQVRQAWQNVAASRSDTYLVYEHLFNIDTFVLDNLVVDGDGYWASGQANNADGLHYTDDQYEAIGRTAAKNLYYGIQATGTSMTTPTLNADFAASSSLVPSVGPTFTAVRSTKATILGAESVLRRVPANFPRFDGSTWSANFAEYSSPNLGWAAGATAVITKNQADPFGGTGATLVAANTDTGTSETVSTLDSLTAPETQGHVCTLSVYAKAGGTNWICLRQTGYGDNGKAWFNVGTGAAGTAEAALEDSGIESIGSGWYRCYITFTITDDTVGQIILHVVDGNEALTTTLDGVASATFAAVQLEVVSGKASYAPSSFIETGAAAAVYSSSGTSNGLHSGNRQNIILQSEDFSTTWVANANATLTANQAVSPDGAKTADLFSDNSATGTGKVALTQNVAGIPTSTDHCYFVFAKKNGLDWIQLEVAGMAAQSIIQYFDLTNGAVGTASADVNSSGINDYGDGWYQCWLTYTSDSSDSSAAATIRVADSDGDDVVAKDGTSSVYVWGAQHQIGTTPDPYIPTTTTAAGDGDDIETSDVTWWGTENSLYVKFNSGTLSGDRTILSLHDSTADERIAVEIQSSTLHVIGVDGGVTQFDITNAVSANTEYELSIGVSENDISAYLNGSSIGTDTGATLPAIATLTIGGDHANSEQPNTEILAVRNYNSLLTDAALENMSNGIFPTGIARNIFDVAKDVTKNITRNITDGFS